MRVATKSKSFIGKEVKLHAVEYNGVITYGIQQDNVVFEDISCNRLVVQGFINLLSDISTKKNFELLHCILVDVADKYQDELINL